MIPIEDRSTSGTRLSSTPLWTQSSPINPQIPRFGILPFSFPPFENTHDKRDVASVKTCHNYMKCRVLKQKYLRRMALWGRQKFGKETIDPNTNCSIKYNNIKNRRSLNTTGKWTRTRQMGHYRTIRDAVIWRNLYHIKIRTPNISEEPGSKWLCRWRCYHDQ